MEIGEAILEHLQKNGPTKNWRIRLALRDAGVLSLHCSATRVDSALQKLKKAHKVRFHSKLGWSIALSEAATRAEQERREQMEKAYPLLIEAAQKALEYLQFIELAEVAQDHLKRGLRAAGKEV